MVSLLLQPQFTQSVTLSEITCSEGEQVLLYNMYLNGAKKPQIQRLYLFALYLCDSGATQGSELNLCAKFMNILNQMYDNFKGITHMVFL